MSGQAWRDIAHDRTLDECTSTNDLIRALGEAGAPHGTWISARKQTAGRGRSGNAWVSESGGLFLSVLLRFDTPGALWTWIPLLVALSARRAILSIRPELAADLKIKWPNDIWLHGKKTAGILCEGVGSRKGSYIIVGIGINCDVAPRVPGLETASVALDPDALRPRILKQVLESLEQATPDGLAREFAACTQFAPGSPVEWRDRHQPGVILGHGTVEGIGASGELLVKTPDGEQQSLYSEDVSLRSGS